MTITVSTVQYDLAVVVYMFRNSRFLCASVRFEVLGLRTSFDRASSKMHIDVTATSYRLYSIYVYCKEFKRGNRVSF